MKMFCSTIVCALVAAALIASMLMSTPAIANDQVTAVSPQELKRLIESKSADILVVDNQPKSTYDLGHVPGAINFPWREEISDPVNLPRDKTLIIYCACSHEEDATDTAQQLMSQFG
jgi:rhodanese-related sulfurtransferase